MFASVHQVATDESIEAEAKQLAETFRSVRELTRIAEKESHEVVIACPHLIEDVADGKLGCSNVGIACTPSGQWRCSLPKKTEEGTK